MAHACEPLHECTRAPSWGRIAVRSAGEIQNVTSAEDAGGLGIWAGSGYENCVPVVAKLGNGLAGIG